MASRLLLPAVLFLLACPGRISARASGFQGEDARPGASAERSGPATGETAPAAPSEWRLLSLGFIRAYQLALSSQDTPGCPFQPSCSHFGQESIRRYGLQGLLMTSDRLLRCNGTGLGFYPVDVRSGRRPDPPEAHALRQKERREAGSGDAATAEADRERLSALAEPERQPSAEGNARGTAEVRLVRAFADHLYAEHDYARAASEYRRYLFFAGESTADRDTVRLRLGVSQRHSGSPDAALREFHALLGRETARPLWCAALVQLCATWWDLDRPAEALRELDRLCVEQEGVCLECPVSGMRGLSELLLGRWPAAEATLGHSALPAFPGWAERAATLRAIAAKGARLPQKSPWVAGALSAVLPGAGRVYAGRTWDGVASLATIGLFTWGAVSGFQEDGWRSRGGLAYAGVGLGFHLGNIYGSAIEARNHNRSRAGELVNRARAEIPRDDP